MGNDSETFMKYFTKKMCYPNQKEAMREISLALESEKAVLFEGACGTGKTLSSLAPALDIAERKKKTVLIVTNVHQQMVQFINEARDIQEQADFKALVVRGKRSMCPLHVDYEECRAKTEKTYDILKLENERLKMVKDLEERKKEYKETKDPDVLEEIKNIENKLKEFDESFKKSKSVYCPFLYEVVRSDELEFRKWVFETVRSSEEVTEYAAARGMCGYELLKKEMKRAQLLICNYHHVLNRDIFLTILTWIEKLPEDVIVIFDEAHNIENAARSHSSITISERTLDRAINEIEEHPDYFPESPRIDTQRIWNAFYEAIMDTYKFKLGPNAEERIGHNWSDIKISDPTERFDIVRERFLSKIKKLTLTGLNHKKQIDEKYDEKEILKYISSLMRSVSRIGLSVEEDYREKFKSGNAPLRKSHIRNAADFLDAYLLLYGNPNYYPILNVRKDSYSGKNEIYGRMEIFTCIPRSVTQELFNSLGGLVLMSATLRPFNMIRETLGLERECVEIAYNTTFPIDRRKTFAVSVPPLFSSTRLRQETSNAVEYSLISAIKSTPGNVLIYFQSSSEAIRYGNFLRAAFGDSLKIFIDEPDANSNDIREAFFKIGESGGKAVLVSYILGTLSEGIDFQNNRARTVIIVGVGYPALNDRIRAVESAYDLVFGDGKGWEFAISVPTMRRIRQAMGRVVRSPTDYGVRILLDARFQKASVRTLGKYSVYNQFPDEEKDEIEDITPKEIGAYLNDFFSKMN